MQRLSCGLIAFERVLQFVQKVRVGSDFANKAPNLFWAFAVGPVGHDVSERLFRDFWRVVDSVHDLGLVGVNPRVVNVTVALRAQHVVDVVEAGNGGDLERFVGVFHNADFDCGHEVSDPQSVHDAKALSVWIHAAGVEEKHPHAALKLGPAVAKLANGYGVGDKLRLDEIFWNVHDRSP